MAKIEITKYKEVPIILDGVSNQIIDKVLTLCLQEIGELRK